MILKILSWNIEGKHYMLKNNKIKIALSEYDILFIHETHCTKEMTFQIKGFQSFRMAMPVWLREKLFLKDMLIKEIKKIDGVHDDFQL